MVVSMFLLLLGCVFVEYINFYML